MNRRVPPLNELLWQAAIEGYMRYGDASSLKVALLRDEPIPAEARAWLFGIVTGTIRRPRGKPQKRAIEVLRLDEFMFREGVRDRFRRLQRVYQRRGCHGDTPTGSALQSTAEHFGLTADQVSKIVYPRDTEAG